MQNTRLSRCVFDHCGLAGTDFTGARLLSTIFSGSDMSRAIGLDSALHASSTGIGVDSLIKSKGNIPESFLRGAGLPDEWITYARSLITNPIEFNSCFISYSSKDQDFAERLYADLQNNGVRCWFSPHHIKGGQKLLYQIEQALQIHERVLLILSPDSINSSWVRTEIEKTRRRENAENRQMLFPIRLVDFETLKNWKYFDSDTGTDHAKEIREYFIPDFSNWKDHDSYQKAFKKLLEDLKKGERSKAR